ncbi:YaiI/YqxD family protein [Marinomonas spartinae]|uniref:YaiI/YqxD family protein n=1 Tax=Marinomonas spartinae TaxID=1792290 RepID=UPI0018F17666|nr:YaiI/YqxD family protein [Marinomonas spartinae]MBJ7556903.1 YaiI/YqxD family protein [Marinomonas spartinae]
MRIWVDADACPNVIKTILFRAAERVNIPCILVANQAISIPPSKWIERRVVSSGFDVADNYIVEQVENLDLVVTADIPLASEVIAKGALAINPRGELYSKENIKQRLAMRDFMEQMRSSGIQSDGPSTFSQQDRMAFANTLDKLLTQRIKTE